MTIKKQFAWEDAYATTVPLVNADGLLKWPFDNLLPVEVRFYTYDPRRDFRVCRHDHFEVFYLYSGDLVFYVDDRIFPLHKGDLILISSTNYHTMRSPSKHSGAPTAYGVHLYFMPEVIRCAERSGEDIRYLSPFLQQDPAFPRLITAETGLPLQVFNYMQLIRSHLPPISPRARLSIKTYLKVILITLVNYYSVFDGLEYPFDRRQNLIERLGPLFTFLDEHYSDHISLDEAAGVVNMSKSHFLHLMKQVTGLSFVAYLNQFRIAKAQSLLAGTDKSIGEVSAAVGFGDHSYFTHVFRKLLGLTPAQYRLELQLGLENSEDESTPGGKVGDRK